MVIDRLQGEKLDPRFIAYYLGSCATPHVDSRLVGAVQQHFNVVLAASPSPSTEHLEQCAIAHILGMLDDKIELNRRMNETLESIARRYSGRGSWT